MPPRTRSQLLEQPTEPSLEEVPLDEDQEEEENPQPFLGRVDTNDDRFLKAFEGIADALKTSADQSKGKSVNRTFVKEPDTFDGSDPRKLRFFITRCRLHFRSRPEAFEDDSSKVMFALSYLKGTAFEYFKPALSGVSEDDMDWLEDWDAFVDILETQFGPYDAVGDAENDIMTLKMRDNQRISEFIVKFNSLQTRLDWGDSALRHRFYLGLPARLKDEICRGDGKPSTLQAMRLKAQRIDARYWERKNEITREQAAERTSKPEGKQSSNSGKQQTQQGNATSSNKEDKKPSNSGKQQASTSATQQPDLSGKLGKDGKITAKERQYRMEKNLCLYCGDKNHRVADCPVVKANAAKARAANAAATSDSSTSKKEDKSTSESKKD